MDNLPFALSPVLAVSGMYISDKLQARMPVEGDDKDAPRKPKLLGFSVVDRKEKPS